MSSRHKLILFYSTVSLVVCDVFAIAHRFTLHNPDSVSWAEVVVALIGQVAIILVLVALLPFLTQKRDAGRAEILLFGTLGFKAVVVIALGMFAALSVTLLNHGMSCGDHPIPSRSTPNTCPK